MLLCNVVISARNNALPFVVQQGLTDVIELRQLRVLLLGDSITAGWTRGGSAINSYGIQFEKLLKKEGYNIQVEIRGIPGEAVLDSMTQTTRVILDNEESLGRHFDYAIVLAGTNDVFRGYPAPKIVSGLQFMYRRILEHGARVMILTIPEFDWDRVNHNEPKRKHVNASLRALVSEQNTTELYLYDFAYAFPLRSLDSDARNRLWDLDHIHPSVCGYDVMGDMIHNEFKKILKM